MRFALLLALTACAHRPPPSVEQDVAAGLSLAGLALTVTGASVDDPQACVGIIVAGATVSDAGRYLAHGGAVLPAVHIDYSGCGALPAAVEVPDVGAALSLALEPVRAVLARVTASERCETQRIVDAVAVRLALLAQVVADELATPDGVVDLPPIPIEVCP